MNILKRRESQRQPSKQTNAGKQETSAAKSSFWEMDAQQALRVNILACHEKSL